MLVVVEGSSSDVAPRPQFLILPLAMLSHLASCYATLLPNTSSLSVHTVWSLTLPSSSRSTGMVESGIVNARQRQ